VRNPAPSRDPVVHQAFRNCPWAMLAGWVLNWKWRSRVGGIRHKGGRSDDLLHRMSSTQQQPHGDARAAFGTRISSSRGEPRIHRTGYSGARRHGSDARGRGHPRSALGQRPISASLTGRLLLPSDFASGGLSQRMRRGSARRGRVASGTRSHAKYPRTRERSGDRRASSRLRP
jgi:hypothetical protein